MRSPRILVVAALALAAAASGCSDLFSTGDAHAQLDRNREKWESHPHRTYSFTVQHICFCAITGPVRVTVVDDSVVSATQLTPTSPVQAVDTRYVESVGALFDFIALAISRPAATLDITYDPTFGFPTRIVYDGSVNIADDEMTIAVSDLRFQTSAPN